MKKTPLFAIFLLIISGCTVNHKNLSYVPFEESEVLFSENLNFLLNEINSTLKYPNYSTNIDIMTDDNNLKLDANILFSGFTDNLKNHYLNIFPDIYFFDKKENKEITISGFMENIQKNKQYYTRFSNFSVNMGSGNYESDLRYLIIKNLGDKRIKFDSEKLDRVQNIKNNIDFLLNTISSSKTFENIEQVTYEGDAAYKISIKNDILDFIKNNTNINILDFNGLFIIKSNNQIELKINNIQLSYMDDFGIKDIIASGIIGKDNGEILFSENGKNMKFSYELHRKYTKFELTELIDFNEVRNFSINISKTPKKLGNKYEIKGKLRISPILIYGSNLEKRLDMDIRGTYENFDGEIFEIKEPSSFLLLDQILGDEFSIKNFI